MNLVVLCRGYDNYRDKLNALRQWVKNNNGTISDFEIVHGFKGYKVYVNRTNSGLGPIVSGNPIWFMTSEDLRAFKEAEPSNTYHFLDSISQEFYNDSGRIVRHYEFTGYGITLRNGYYISETPNSSVKKPVELETESNVASDEIDVKRARKNHFKIQRVVFNGPATIVFWKDGTKTVSKCREGDPYSKEAGLAICYMKRALGNHRNFNKAMKRWLEKTNAEKAADMGMDDTTIRKIQSVEKEETNEG